MKTPRLTIELVPESSWYENLRSRLPKDAWDRLRKKTYALARHKCEICGGKGDKWPVECHEIWSYDKKSGIQKLTGLIALCPACHEVKHIGLAGIKGNSQRAMQHLCEINGWSMPQAETYVKDAFRLWEQRSLMSWTLDLSWLDEEGDKLRIEQIEEDDVRKAASGGFQGLGIKKRP